MQTPPFRGRSHWSATPGMGADLLEGLVVAGLSGECPHHGIDLCVESGCSLDEHLPLQHEVGGGTSEINSRNVRQLHECIGAVDIEHFALLAVADQEGCIGPFGAGCQHLDVLEERECHAQLIHLLGCRRASMLVCQSENLRAAFDSKQGATARRRSQGEGRDCPSCPSLRG
jgi:hypothetical protein